MVDSGYNQFCAWQSIVCAFALLLSAFIQVVLHLLVFSFAFEILWMNLFNYD